MPFRIRVSISAIGSVTAIVGYRRSSALPGTFGSPGGSVSFSPIRFFGLVFAYQLDLVTPGISPLSASCRKHKRHIWNLRRTPRGRPQMRHRFLKRILNLGFLASLAIIEV